MFPDEALDIAVELKLGGTWVDIKTLGHVYTRDPITITRGRQDEGSRSDPATCSMTINNKDGRYSPRNPNGPYYGLIGRNTPIRVSAGVGDVALSVPEVSGSGASTPDAAAIDITGDLDVRVDATLAWDDEDGGLVGKYVETGNQRSWILWLNSNRTLTLYWSTTGSNLLSATSTAPVPLSVGRQAVRATLDVNNGASGRTITFYTSGTLAGSWTQLGAPVVQAGTTSIFNSSAPLTVASVYGLVAGRFWKVEVRNGIGGTVAANPDFAAQADGATGFTDASGRAWTVIGDAALTPRALRFMGEVPAWPSRWGPSGEDVHVQIEAAGITRRLGQGRKPLASALRRAVAGATQAYLGYWPMEDGAGATQAASAVPGVAPLRAIGPVEFSEEASGGTAGGATFGDGGKLVGTSPTIPPSVWGDGAWLIIFWFDLPADMGTSGVSPIVQWRTPGAPIAHYWDLYTGQSVNGVLFLEVADSANNIATSAGGTIDLRGRGPVQVAIYCNNNGVSNTNILVYVDGVMDIATAVTSDQASTPTAIGVNLNVAAGTDFSGSVSHLIVAPYVSWQDRLALDLVPAGLGYRGEAAGTRFARLCDEEGLPAAVIGDPAATEAMGAQLPAPVLDLLADCEDADGGTLYEARDQLALRYRPRSADYNTPPALVLDYHDQLAAPLEPVDDDQGTRNDVTVERVGGSSARVVIDEGPLSVNAPPDGVGIYDESLTLNVAYDDQLLPIAGWRAHLGTVDEARYPVVRVKLHKHPELIDTVTAMDARARIHLTGLPPWEPPGTVDLIADGYTETLESRRWVVEYNTVPGSPWRTGVLDDPVLGRVDTDGAVLAKAAGAGDTTLLVTSTDGPSWTTDPAEVPFDLRVGGEVVTVTAVGDGIVDGFDRTVSNGWGTAPDGQTWTAYGTASDYSVASSSARITISATNTTDLAGLSLPTLAASDVELAFTSPATAITGGPVHVFLIARFDPAAFTWYNLRASLYNDGTVRLLLQRRQGGFTFLTSEQVIPGLTPAVSTTYRMRFFVQGGLLQGKIWLNSGTEPPWQIQALDTALDGLPGGDIGVQVFVPSGVTSALPLTFGFPELRAHNPQKLTVTRAVNGISKAQSLGTGISLDQPSVIAL
ncbi:hypothetical protein AB0C69_11050 [Actinomadura sp. NPDC048032]|uniref:hypothetical protein n=1 Tax=Actinomadura sp. NPDC048032 TaxID=3155747 RepID=UPI003408882F